MKNGLDGHDGFIGKIKRSRPLQPSSELKGRVLDAARAAWDEAIPGADDVSWWFALRPVAPFALAAALLIVLAYLWNDRALSRWSGMASVAVAQAERPATILDSWEDGRVALLLAVLDDIYGLPPSTSGVQDEPSAPEGGVFRWALHQNVPNPWSAGTEIRYDVAADTRVRVRIYSTTGQFIRTLVDRRMEPGRHVAVWDGRSESGKRVADGIYFYKMEAGGFAATKKMILMR